MSRIKIEDYEDFLSYLYKIDEVEKIEQAIDVLYRLTEIKNFNLIKVSLFDSSCRQEDGDSSVYLYPPVSKEQVLNEFFKRNISVVVLRGDLGKDSVSFDYVIKKNIFSIALYKDTSIDIRELEADLRLV